MVHSDKRAVAGQKDGRVWLQKLPVFPVGVFTYSNPDISALVIYRNNFSFFQATFRFFLIGLAGVESSGVLWAQTSSVSPPSYSYSGGETGYYRQKVDESPDSGEQRQDRELLSAAASAAVSATNSMEVLNNERKLTYGDVLSLRIVEDEGRIIKLYITQSGEIEVPYIGRVMGKGETCQSLAYKIKKLLEVDYYKRATVIIGYDYNSYGRNRLFGGAVCNHIWRSGKAGKNSHSGS